MTPSLARKLNDAEATAHRILAEMKAEAEPGRRRILLSQLTHAQRLVDAIKIEAEALASGWTPGDPA